MPNQTNFHEAKYLNELCAINIKFQVMYA